MRQKTKDFRTFLKERDDAARAYVRGDAGPLGGVLAGEATTTFFGPRGGYKQGAQEVWSTYERGARAFAPGGDSTLEVLDRGESDGIAYWVGFQRAGAVRGELRAHTDRPTCHGGVPPGGRRLEAGAPPRRPARRPRRRGLTGQSPCRRAVQAEPNIAFSM